MKSIAVCLFLAAFSGPALAHSEADVFRPVSFICSSSPSGTATKTMENILGQRRSYRVTYVDGEATLFVISRANHGTNFKAVKLIDLRSDSRLADLETAKTLSLEMARGDDLYCTGTPGQKQAARDELLANHQFNQGHPRYRGK